MKVSGWSERTIPDYERNVRFLFDWLDAETTVTDLSQVTRETLAQYQTSLYYQAARRERPLAIATQFTRLSVLRTFFRFLVRHDYLVHDPATALELPKRRRMLPRDVLTRREVERLLAQPDVKTPLGLRDRAILEVLYSTGMRNAELRALTRYDVDTAAGTVRIVRGKNAKDRVIPLGQVAANYVQEYITEARPQLVRDDTTLLFLSKKGRWLTGDNLLVRIEKYARAAKLAKPVGAHAFRHTCATHLLKKGPEVTPTLGTVGPVSVRSTDLGRRPNSALDGWARPLRPHSRYMGTEGARLWVVGPSPTRRAKEDTEPSGRKRARAKSRGRVRLQKRNRIAYGVRGPSSWGALDKQDRPDGRPRKSLCGRSARRPERLRP